MTGIHLLILMLLFFGIMPNLGFFTPAGVFILFILLCLLFVYFLQQKKETANQDSNVHSLLIIILLAYSALYYGGLYQSSISKVIGQAVFFLMIILMVLMKFAFRKNIPLMLVVSIYVILSLFTVASSPNPHVDTIVVLREAPLKLLAGINPYNTTYTRVYQNIVPNYYNYLPFSIVFFIPFIVIFRDPRYASILASLGTFILFYLMFKKNKNRDIVLPLSLLLFLPGSYYMLEHIYLDPVVFFFFTAAVYMLNKSKGAFYLLLSLFFSFKQNFLIALPLFISKKLLSDKRSLALIAFPFLIIVPFFLWDMTAFIKNTLLSLQPANITSPIGSSLTLPTFLILLFNIPKSGRSAIYLFSFLLFALLYLFIIFRKGMTVSQKIILTTFLSYFLSYHAFFNSYYFVGLLVVYDYLKTEFISSGSKKPLP